MAQLVLCSSQNSVVFFLTARCHLMVIWVFELSHLLLDPCTWIWIARCECHLVRSEQGKPVPVFFHFLWRFTVWKTISWLIVFCMLYWFNHLRILTGSLTLRTLIVQTSLCWVQKMLRKTSTPMRVLRGCEMMQDWWKKQCKCALTLAASELLQEEVLESVQVRPDWLLNICQEKVSQSVCCRKKYASCCHYWV